jgi:hypothetical protein
MMTIMKFDKQTSVPAITIAKYTACRLRIYAYHSRFIPEGVGNRGISEITPKQKRHIKLLSC